MRKLNPGIAFALGLLLVVFAPFVLGAMISTLLVVLIFTVDQLFDILTFLTTSL